MKIIHREFLETSTKTCHAATVEIYNGEPVFSWFGGSREGEADSNIYVQKNGKVFSEDKRDQIPRWNPILFEIEDRLFLFTKRGIFCDRWQTFVQEISSDDSLKNELGKSKYQQVIPAGLNGPVKTRPVVNDGLIYCGASVETSWDWSSYIEVYVFRDGKFEYVNRSSPLTVDKVEYTHPFYKSKLMTQGIIQPSIWTDKYEHMHAVFRSSNGLGVIYSSDYNGLRWLDPVNTDLPNPNSGVDTVYYDESLFIVYNPSERLRSPLIIGKFAEDFEIEDQIVITKDLPEGCFSQELSYPYMIERDGIIHLCYTYGRSKIEYVQVKI